MDPGIRRKLIEGAITILVLVILWWLLWEGNSDALFPNESHGTE